MADHQGRDCWGTKDKPNFRPGWLFRLSKWFYKSIGVSRWSYLGSHARNIDVLKKLPIAEANKDKSWTHQKRRTQSSSRRKSVSFSDHTLAQLHELDEQSASHDRLIKDVRMCSSHSNMRSLPITELVGHKHTNNIPSYSGPKRTICLKRSLTNP